MNNDNFNSRHIGTEEEQPLPPPAEIAAHLFRIAKHSGTSATKHQITHYLVCRKCESLPRARQHALKRSALQIGITPRGLQIWCTLHDNNVAHIDLELTKHPVVFSANCLSIAPPAKPLFPPKKTTAKKKSRARSYPFVMNSGSNLSVIDA
jgi:hypothetical protein